MLDTIQDNGRYGYQHLGINPGGAMDRYAAQLANSILGKSPEAPVIELHFPASSILFLDVAIISITGGNFQPVINDVACNRNEAIVIGKNSVLKFNGRKDGARCYLGILPEMNLACWLNSFSTNLKAKTGGWKGRQFRAGDEIPFSKKIVIPSNQILPKWAHRIFTITNHHIIQILEGSEWHTLSESSRMSFQNDFFTISRLSDRMGYRLTGTVLESQDKCERVSTAVTFGSIQLLPDGQLVILMADHQTTGGYAQLGCVISADLPLLAQAQPGDSIGFTFTNMQNAEMKMMEQQNFLSTLKEANKTRIENAINAEI